MPACGHLLVWWGVRAAAPLVGHCAWLVLLQVQSANGCLWVQTRVRLALAVAVRRSLSVTLRTGGAPVAAPDPDGLAVSGEGAKSVEDPPLAHPGCRDEIGDRDSFWGCLTQRSPQQRIWDTPGLLRVFLDGLVADGRRVALRA